MNDERLMYNWGFLNSSGATIQAFQPFAVVGWHVFESTLYLIASSASSEGPHAVCGPSPVSANGRGACAFPGAHWAKLSSAYSSGTTVGPVPGTPALSKDGEGYVTVGTVNSQGRTLVVLRESGEGEQGPAASLERFEMIEDKAAEDDSGSARLLFKIDYNLEVPDETFRLQLEIDDDPFTSDPAIGDIVKQTFPESFWLLTASPASAFSSWQQVVEAGQEIRIVDPDHIYTAYGPYVDCAGNGEDSVPADPNANPPVEAVAGIGGFRGSGFRFTDDYDGTGFPGYYVSSIEALVPAIYVELEDLAPGSEETDFKPKLVELPDAIVPAVGSNEHNRLPKQETFTWGGSNPTGGPLEDINGVAGVEDRHEVLENPVEGEIWQITLEPRSDVYVYSFSLKRPATDLSLEIAVTAEEILPLISTLETSTPQLPPSTGDVKPGEGIGYLLAPNNSGSVWTVADSDFINLLNFSSGAVSKNSLVQVYKITADNTDFYVIHAEDCG